MGKDHVCWKICNVWDICMNKILLQVSVFGFLTLTSCKDTQKTFSVYEVNPLKESLSKNKIKYYIAYEYDEHDWMKGDSVSIDNNGNILSRINKGPGFAEEFYFYYDSLNRVIYETQRSDILTKICTRYELIPERQTVIKYISFCENAKDVGELVEQIVLAYDNDLDHILYETVVEVSTNDTTKTTYEYNDNRIYKESREVDGQKRIMTEYIYDNGRLDKIIYTHRPNYYSTSFISKKTGLIDSTITRQDGIKWLKRYQYF
jgi:hypothetical protein